MYEEKSKPYYNFIKLTSFNTICAQLLSSIQTIHATFANEVPKAI